MRGVPSRQAQHLEGDSIGGEAVVLDPFCVGVFFAVEEDAAT
jgi:hypothetical protein